MSFEPLARYWKCVCAGHHRTHDLDTDLYLHIQRDASGRWHGFLADFGGGRKVTLVEGLLSANEAQRALERTMARRAAIKPEDVVVDEALVPSWVHSKLKEIEVPA